MSEARARGTMEDSAEDVSIAKMKGLALFALFQLNEISVNNEMHTLRFNHLSGSNLQFTSPDIMHWGS